MEERIHILWFETKVFAETTLGEENGVNNNLYIEYKLIFWNFYNYTYSNLSVFVRILLVSSQSLTYGFYHHWSPHSKSARSFVLSICSLYRPELSVKKPPQTRLVISKTNKVLFIFYDKPIVGYGIEQIVLRVTLNCSHPMSNLCLWLDQVREQGRNIDISKRQPFEKKPPI